MKNKRKILVTGASGGIGYSIAKKFLENDDYVGLHYCVNKENAEKLSADFKNARIFQADFSNSKGVFRLTNEFLNWKKGCDILINNAGGVFGPAPIADIHHAAWDKTFHVNVKAPFFLMQRLFPSLKKTGFGRVVNISSIGVKFGGGKLTTHYSAAKAALEALTRSFSKEGASSGILVNTIRVGVCETDFHKKMGRTDLNQRKDLIPLKRLCQPQEVADLVFYLCSEKASYMTGSILTLSGGE